MLGVRDTVMNKVETPRVLTPMGKWKEITRQLHGAWSLWECLAPAWKISEGFRGELKPKLRSEGAARTDLIERVKEKYSS